jgi:hypothetical protein
VALETALAIFWTSFVTEERNFMRPSTFSLWALKSFFSVGNTSSRTAVNKSRFSSSSRFLRIMCPSPYISISCPVGSTLARITPPKSSGSASVETWIVATNGCMSFRNDSKNSFTSVSSSEVNSQICPMSSCTLLSESRSSSSETWIFLFFGWSLARISTVPSGGVVCSLMWSHYHA